MKVTFYDDNEKARFVSAMVNAKVCPCDFLLAEDCMSGVGCRKCWTLAVTPTEEKEDEHETPIVIPITDEMLAEIRASINRGEIFK